MSVDLIRIDATNNPVALLAYAPRRARNVSIIAGHGYSSSKHNLDFLCSFLASHGFAVYSLDFPGHKLGASGGTLRGIDDCIDAMTSVVNYARNRESGPVLTLGHSMGAMTALFTAARDPQIAGVIAIATGYGRPSALQALRNLGSTDFRSSYVAGVDLPTLLTNVDEYYARWLPLLDGREQLYVAASHDAMVSPASVRDLYERAPDGKSFATIESDHTYAGEHARGEVLQWLNRLFPRN